MTPLSSLPALSKTCILFAALATVASAATLRLNTTAHSNVGGVFTVTHYGDLDVSHYDSSALYNAVSGNNGLGFGTFCLEYSEPFNPGQTFDYELAGYASNGGLGGATNNRDTISMGTAFLYQLFASGGLDSYAASAGRSFSYTNTTHLRNLQSAFWFLEDEGQGSVSNSYVQLAIGMYGTLANAKVHHDGSLGVSVLNLTQGGTPKQSQLYYGGLPSVPDAGTTLTLLGGVLAALGLIRRRLA